jgi:hypothetical protein
MAGGYEIIQTFDRLPLQEELDRLFYDDSVIRDKDLSFFDRLKRQVPNL